jgi:DNA adenine methylase
LIRPLLKWAGGKRQLLPHLRRFYPQQFGRYVEPFLGSGAVFLDLYNRGHLDGRSVTLLDSNTDLIGCYRAVRDHPDDVIAALTRLERGHARRGSEHYYKVRDEQFNPRRRQQNTTRAASAYPPELAAMLIYLNRSGYNGLFRLNSKGDFNVPAGRYANPRICDAENIRHLSRALQTPGLTLETRTFESIVPGAQANDFFYFDPPYAPLSRTSAFTSYTPQRFGERDQEALQRVVIALADRGGLVLLSNSTAPEIARLYDESEAARRVGLKAYQVEARRAINSRAERRGTVREYVITNIPGTRES